METEDSIYNMYYNIIQPMVQDSSQPMVQDSSQPKSVKYYEGPLIATQFVNYFYQSWVSNPSGLITDNIIKPYSKLQYNDNMYEGSDFVEQLTSFASPGFQFVDCKWEVLDSGSRQIYILVTGIIKNDFLTQQNKFKNFSQSFMIAYAGENNKKSLKKWVLMNSLLIIKMI